MYRFLVVLCVGYFMQVRCSESGNPRAATGQVDRNPKFSGSYIPAAMQIIAHDTELMKYVIKPPQGITTTTTTTMRPTPPHFPAVFAPPKPLGPSAYFSKRNLQAQYVHIQQQPSGVNYFERFNSYLPPDNQLGRALHSEEDVYDRVEKYIGKEYGEVLKLANMLDPDNEIHLKDEDTQVLEFSKNFEDSDSNYRYEFLRQKRVPPTKAYVTLLSLYDMLNKEAKRMMLNKFAGYSEEVLNNLIKFSSSTSSYQLRATLDKVLQKGDIKKSDVVNKIKTLIADLDQERSYINDALKDIPPLVFAH